MVHGRQAHSHIVIAGEDRRGVVGGILENDG
jgi:hypothetical protein